MKRRGSCLPIQHRLECTRDVNNYDNNQHYLILVKTIPFTRNMIIVSKRKSNAHANFLGDSSAVCACRDWKKKPARHNIECLINKPGINARYIHASVFFSLFNRFVLEHRGSYAPVSNERMKRNGEVADTTDSTPINSRKILHIFSSLVSRLLDMIDGYLGICWHSTH